MERTAHRWTGVTAAVLLASLPVATQAEEEFMPWAPATAGLPSIETSVNRVYVHGIKPSVGMDESIGPPLSAAFVAAVRKSPWAKGREIMSADEIRLSSPNVANFIEGCASGPCVVEIARSVGCGVAISATVSKVGTTFLVDAMVVESQKGTVLGRETERVRGRTEDSLLDSRGLPKVIKKLLQDLPELKQAPKPTAVAKAPPPAEPTQPQKPTPTEPPPAPQTKPPAEAPAPTAEPAQPPAAPAAGAADAESSDDMEADAEVASAEEGAEEGEDGATAAEPPPEPPPVATAPTEEEEGGVGQVLSIGGYVLLGTAVLVAAGGGLAHLMAVNADGELEKQPHAANQVNAIISQGILYQNAAFVLYGVGGAALLLGIAGVGGGACL